MQPPASRGSLWVGKVESHVHGGCGEPGGGRFVQMRVSRKASWRRHNQVSKVMVGHVQGWQGCKQEEQYPQNVSIGAT